MLMMQSPKKKIKVDDYGNAIASPQMLNDPSHLSQGSQTGGQENSDEESGESLNYIPSIFANNNGIVSRNFEDTMTLPFDSKKDDTANRVVEINESSFTNP